LVVSVFSAAKVIIFIELCYILADKLSKNYLFVTFEEYRNSF